MQIAPERKPIVVRASSLPSPGFLRGTKDGRYSITVSPKNLDEVRWAVLEFRENWSRLLRHDISIFRGVTKWNQKLT